jgi:hypothetical protein
MENASSNIKSRTLSRRTDSLSTATFKFASPQNFPTHLLKRMELWILACGMPVAAGAWFGPSKVVELSIPDQVSIPSPANRPIDCLEEYLFHFIKSRGPPSNSNRRACDRFPKEGHLIHFSKTRLYSHRSPTPESVRHCLGNRSRSLKKMCQCASAPSRNNYWGI